MRFFEEIDDAFSAEQLVTLGQLLNLKNDEEIRGAAAGIFGVLVGHMLTLSASERIPDRTEKKKKLGQIGKTARKLELLLRDFDLTAPLTDAPSQDNPNFPALKGMARMLYRKPLWDLEQVKVFDLIELLVYLRVNAYRLMDNDDSFSFYFMLPPANRISRDFVANSIWPRLFKLWEMAGRKVACSPKGPTMRYLQFIHEVAGLEAPSASALRTAVERWGDDPTRDRPELAPWEGHAFF